MREFLSLEKNYDAERQTQAEKRDEKKTENGSERRKTLIKKKSDLKSRESSGLFEALIFKWVCLLERVYWGAKNENNYVSDTSTNF